MSTDPNREKNERNRAAEEKTARQITALLKPRIPHGHGFALLTFPLGPAVDARMRYIGTGNREDIINAMEHWCEQQRIAYKFGDGSRAATQWTNNRPKEPGFYLMRVAGTFPEFDRVSIFREEDEFLVVQTFDHAARVWRDGRRVKDLDQTRHLWLGPIPEPWRTEGHHGCICGDEFTPYGPDEAAAHQKLLEGRKPSLSEFIDQQAEKDAIDEEAAKLAKHHFAQFELAFANYVNEKQNQTNTPHEPIPPFVYNLLQEAAMFGFAQGVAARELNPLEES